ncbi:MAG: dihydroorotate dehydrogenase electron transfer subunit [Candidatus Dormibacteraeota bacterium]|nr:dihydroorotate dehydrogenase electron transfer subunit [Candidatus Dormibacteraeota bacterium]
MTASSQPSAADLVGESDLTLAVEEVATCLGVDSLGENLFEVLVLAPRIQSLAEPGQFAQLLVDEGPVPLLRRPFSFSRSDPRSGMVSFYLAAVGQGSRRLSRLRPGDQLRMLGPLGRGFSLPETRGTSVVVAGGLGAAPFPLLMTRLLQGDERVVFVNGARRALELYPEERLPRGLSSLVVRTEDGSRGQAGRVTDGLLDLMKGADRVYACGPNAMLSALVAIWEETGPGAGVERPRLEVSIEAPMGCGFGTCLGCAIPLRLPSGDPAEGPLGLCCRQGPVLDGRELDWPRLLLQPSHLG